MSYAAESQQSAPTLKRDEFLAAAHRPIELPQNTARQYLTQNATEKWKVLRALLSNCTMNDGSLTVTMKSPYGALARMKEGKDWLGVLAEYRTAVLVPSTIRTSFAEAKPDGSSAFIPVGG
jgi:hypothetical protein